MSDVSVVLKPVKTTRRDPEIGEVEIPSPTLSILVSTAQMKQQGREQMEVGLVNIVPGRPINFLPPISRFSPDQKQEIEKQAKACLERIAKSQIEAATSDEDKKLLAKNAEEEQKLDRKAFFPPTDQEMIMPPPASMEEAVEQETRSDDVDAIV